MASFFEKYSMGIACSGWCKGNPSSKEIKLEEVSTASNPSPKSPLDVDFEKETGITTGLGLVPYLARLCEEDPYNRRIVFGINMTVDLFSRSLIEVSVANTFELITLNLNPPARLFSYPSTPSSLFSPLSHTPLMGSQPDMDVPDHEMPFDPHYFLFIRDESHEEDDQSVGSGNVSVPIDSESEDDLVLSENHSEHVNDDSSDGMNAQKISHFAHEEEYSAHDANPVTTRIFDNSSVMEQPRSFVGGLSATFGVRANKRVPKLEDQYPTENSMMRYCFCEKALTNEEQNDSIFFKYKYSCSSKQCRKMEADTEEVREKAETKAPK